MVKFSYFAAVVKAWVSNSMATIPPIRELVTSHQTGFLQEYVYASVFIFAGVFVVSGLIVIFRIFQ